MRFNNNLLVTNSKNAGVLIGSCECLSLWPYQAMIYVERDYYVPSENFRAYLSLIDELRICPSFRAGLFPLAVRRSSDDC